MKIEESLNVKFNESPLPKSPPLEDDDVLECDIIENKEKDLEIKENDPLNKEIIKIKESKDHPLETSIDENGVVSRNKSRLVAQGYNQQERIDFNETYAPVARLESIRILLDYDCAHDFELFQMDVRSDFLNGFINEEVYVAQTPGFIYFEKPNHVFNSKRLFTILNKHPKLGMIDSRIPLFLSNWSTALRRFARGGAKMTQFDDLKAVIGSVSLMDHRDTIDPNTSYIIKFKMPKEKKLNLKRTVRISVCLCCFSNPQPVSPPYHPQSAPPLTPNASPSLSPIISLGISPSKVLLTLKTTPPPLTFPLLALTQPSKHSSPLAINLDPIKLLFSTPHTSPQTVFDTLEDLPPTITKPSPPRPSFDFIKFLANEPPPIMAMEPPVPPMPPQLPTFP
uniref:Copia protein n=1 Tax=Tanacetum cinerariifolium TaxID=118510 RepID=A0A699GQW9_TANCI|nr:copia protein [Tanacetum cinerariifolium]